MRIQASADPSDQNYVKPCSGHADQSISHPYRGRNDCSIRITKKTLRVFLNSVTYTSLRTVFDLYDGRKTEMCYYFCNKYVRTLAELCAAPW